MASKRARKATIIEISDSEDESNGSKRARTQEQDEDYNPQFSSLPLAGDSIQRSSAKPKDTTKKRGRKHIPKNTECQSEDTSEHNDHTDEPTTSTNSNPSRSIPIPDQNSRHISDLLSEMENIDRGEARNIVNLFEEENTIPFICRYRRDMIPENCTPEQLRNIKNTFIEIMNLKKKANYMIKQLQTNQILTPEIQSQILNARTVEQLEFLYAPFKPASKSSLANRAKSLGLERYAEHILHGQTPPLLLEDIVDSTNVSLNSVDKVLDWICHIVSHIFAKNTDVLEELRKLKNNKKITLKSSKSKSVTKENNNISKEDAYKYEKYYDFEEHIKSVKPHQILAINRGENAKILSIKLNISTLLKESIKGFILKTFLTGGIQYSLRTMVFEKSFEECYTKRMKPYLYRQIRSDLNDMATKGSIEVFAKNLKQLLLMSPMKGEKILGIDPGFRNGCKLALISEIGDVLETAVIYPHSNNRTDEPERSEEKMLKMLIKHKCKLIALGNGSACRETELWLTHLYNNNILNANEVKYSIVSEQGASIYSCSSIAKEEFPDLDVNLISAVSIARRLNDPLSEYVKIEPRHIGVGMYQHDINAHLLEQSLNEVVMECVSFVGVDINTASLSLLKFVAGLTESRAKNIIEYRSKIGTFKKRSDLLKVKGIGNKSFTQCAGFIRIDPKSIGEQIPNVLDCTWVHPESYDIAQMIMTKCKLNIKDIGKPEFMRVIQNFNNPINLDYLEIEHRTPRERIESVLDALQRNPFQDYRSDINKKPLFKQGIMKITDLRNGSVVTGAVNNVTHFGAFVDIGVDKNGLIHSSNMRGYELNVGDRVEVRVLKADQQKQRIELKLENVDGSM